MFEDRCNLGHSIIRIKYFVGQNKILLVLTDRPALFMKTDIDKSHMLTD